MADLGAEWLAQTSVAGGILTRRALLRAGRCVPCPPSHRLSISAALAHTCACSPPSGATPRELLLGPEAIAMLAAAPLLEHRQVLAEPTAEMPLPSLSVLQAVVHSRLEGLEPASKQAICAAVPESPPAIQQTFLPPAPTCDLRLETSLPDFSELEAVFGRFSDSVNVEAPATERHVAISAEQLDMPAPEHRETSAAKQPAEASAPEQIEASALELLCSPTTGTTDYLVTTGAARPGRVPVGSTAMQAGPMVVSADLAGAPAGAPRKFTLLVMENELVSLHLLAACFYTCHSGPSRLNMDHRCVPGAAYEKGSARCRGRSFRYDCAVES